MSRIAVVPIKMREEDAAIVRAMFDYKATGQIVFHVKDGRIVDCEKRTAKPRRKAEGADAA